MLSDGALAAQGTDTDLSAGDPKVRSSQAHDANSTGLPRSVTYGALAGLFLLVAGGVGAHRRRHP
jgi:MYXO-CTERM domain-containing protein